MKKLKLRYVTVKRCVIVTKKVASYANKRGNIYRVIARHKACETVHVAVGKAKGGR